jgi:amidophosphoribosyltransferase
VARYLKGHLALAHNGNLINGDALRSELEAHGSIFQTSSDTEVILNLIARYRQDGSEEALIRALSFVKGAFSLVICTSNQLIGVRDPHGFRPLALGKLGAGYVLASESAAIDAVGGEFVRDISPGEMVIIGEHGVRFRQYSPAKPSSCIFEYVYFARNDSTIDGLNVYRSRVEFGRLLAREHPAKADLVMSVPDSGTPAAIGYALESGLPYEEGLVKNRYVGRTFIQPGQALRELKVRLKLSPNVEVVRGKSVVIVDDSIVRGTTTQLLIKMLKQAGAREVHVRVSCPPYVGPCYFGVDTPSRDELIGATHSTREIQEIIGADSLGYLSLEGMVRATAGARNSFCLGCFTENYPLDVKGLKLETSARKEEWGDIRG